MQIYKTLYSRTSTGAIQQWSIFVEGNSFFTISGQVDGKLVTSKPNKCIGKNLGKENETTPERQALLEAEAKYKKQLKQNYFEDIKEIDNAWLEPQLCKIYKNYKDKVKWPQVVDKKLNGVCCIVTSAGAKSRKNEIFHSIPHILESLARIIQNNPSIYLHGELFNPKHINELNKLAELIAVTRKPKDIDDELLRKSREVVQYHIYDGYGFTVDGKFYGPEEPFEERRIALFELIKVLDYVYPVEFKICSNENEMIKYFQDYVEEGGEGIVLKNPESEYEHKRSKNCLKFKKQEDAEFEVVELLEGSGNWAGICKMALCKLPNGETFKSNVKGTQEYLADVWKRKDEWIGKKITVEFQEYSPYRVPLIPYTNLLVRNYE